MAIDLADFLRARLDEDEHYLRVLTEVGTRKAHAATPQDEADVYGLAISFLSDPDAAQILEQWCDGAVLPPNHHDRLLGEIAAKRRILAEYEARNEDVDLMLGPDSQRQREWSGLWLSARLLAAVWRDHPDYRQEWKP